MKNKGFTLIELLAVIVILAIIALIALPMITGVVEKSRKNSAKASAYGYLEAVENQSLLNDLKDTNTISDGVHDVNSIEVKVNGQIPTSGWIKIDKKRITSSILCINNYKVEIENGKVVNTVKDNSCNAFSELQAGLYDANLNLVVSWDSLVNDYGFDIGKNFETMVGNYYEGSFMAISEAHPELKNVKTIVIPEGTTRIGFRKFSDATNIENVIIPNTVQTISNYAFYNTGLESIVIPESLRTISTNAFENCTKLVNVTIKNGLTTLKDRAFFGCTSLESIELPNSLTTLGHSVFRNCTNLKSAIISDGIKTLSSSTFAHCSNLKTVKLPKNLTTMNADIFINCTSLTSISIPNSVEVIGEEVFMGTSLTSINLPTSLTNIGRSALKNCKNLKKLTIPASVTFIGSSMFDGDDSLNSIVFENTNGWYSTFNPSATSGDSVDVATAATNPSSLKSISFNGNILKRN